MATVQISPEPGAVPAAMREIETKFDLPPAFVVPRLGKVIPPDGRVETDIVHLASTYYDTPALQLLRFRLTVRRRAATGDTDDVGWQVKTPGAGYRTELHWPADDSDQPPDALLSLLAPFRVGAPVTAAVRLEVERHRHRLLDSHGMLVAEIALDDVHAVELGVAVRSPRWTEAEIELGPSGSRSVLARLGRSLTKAGATNSTSRSKLARAVRGIGNESVGDPRASAGALLGDYLDAQIDAIVAGHFAIQRDAEDSIHQTQVAGRRFRSTLRTFSDCYESDAANQLGEELRWYASVLGSVRDLEVMRARVGQAIAQLSPELVVGPIAENVDARLGERLATARAELLAALASERYARLLARLVDWRDQPPYTAAAGRPAATLVRPTRRAQHALTKRLDQATGPDGDDTAMHRARKAGKRARYAAEAAPVAGSSTRARKLQDLLGEFQDSVVTAELVGELTTQARSLGEDTFTYGLLFGEQRARADAIRKRARKRA